MTITATTTTQHCLLSCLVDAAARLGPIHVHEANDLTSASPSFDAGNVSTTNKLEQQRISPPYVVSDDDGSKPPVAPVTTTRKKKSKALPLVLMDLLCDPSYSDILTFLPDGKSFIVLDPCQFETLLMKKNFRVSRFETFERKLELWGFRRDNYVTKEGSRTFHHPRFRRDDMDACRRIRCGRKSQCIIYTAVPAIPIPADPVSVNSSNSVSSVASTMGTRLSSSASKGGEATIKSIPLEISVPLSDATPSSISQSAVDAATRRVVGAALGVLMKDNVHLQIQHGRVCSNPLMLNSTFSDSVPARQLRAKLLAQQQRRGAMRGLLFFR